MPLPQRTHIHIPLPQTPYSYTRKTRLSEAYRETEAKCACVWERDQTYPRLKRHSQTRKTRLPEAYKQTEAKYAFERQRDDTYPRLKRRALRNGKNGFQTRRARRIAESQRRARAPSSPPAPSVPPPHVRRAPEERGVVVEGAQR